MQTRAYEGAFEAVAAIIAAVCLGYWADTHFGSSPIGLVVGAVIGFSAMVVRLLRLGRQLGISEPLDEQGNGQED